MIVVEIIAQMESKKFLVVYNPTAGRKKAYKIAKKYHALNDHLCEFRLISGQSALETSSTLRERLPECDAVIAVGGDGLVNLVLQELLLNPKPLFVHAAGTGNDFHRHNFKKRKFDIQNLDLRLIDLAKSAIDGNVRHFGQALSAGFDSIVNRRANKLRYLPGTLKYVLALLVELPRFKPIHYKLVVDGSHRELDAMMVVVANGPTYGGGMKVLPEASAVDGELDVLVLHPVSKFTLLKVFPKVFLGRHVNHSKVEIFTCKSIAISSSAPIYADGEHFGSGPVFIEVVPSILPLLGSSWK